MPLGDWDPAILANVKRFFAEQIPFNRHLGIQLGELRHGYARLELPFRAEFIGDPFRRALHGGVVSALIDTCGGAAAFTLITPPDSVSTIDLRVDYLRPGRETTLHAEATVSRMGNRVASVDVRTFHPDEPDVLIATGKGVYNVRRVTKGE